MIICYTNGRKLAKSQSCNHVVLLFQLLHYVEQSKFTTQVTKSVIDLINLTQEDLPQALITEVMTMMKMYNLRTISSEEGAGSKRSLGSVGNVLSS